jgi:hypothetical protein
MRPSRLSTGTLWKKEKCRGGGYSVGKVRQVLARNFRHFHGDMVIERNEL